jgi:hypothetical protein
MHRTARQAALLCSHTTSSEFISALLQDFRQGGPAAIAKVRKYQPAAYMKICALMVPKENMVEPSHAGLQPSQHFESETC